MREAIEQYVEREERREQLRHDAAAAWTEYQATGQHVTREEADAWLSRLEAGEDVGSAVPHFLAAEAITEYLGVNEWQVAGITQAINSLDRGEGVSHDQVKDWVSSWGNESEKPIPKRS
jgi:predicted transcriptional regulator